MPTAEELNAMGERAVRDALDDGKYGDQRLATARFVSAWLADKEFARSARKEAIAEEALSVAKEANLIARLACRWAMYAAIIATTAIAIATQDQILTFIARLLP